MVNSVEKQSKQPKQEASINGAFQDHSIEVFGGAYIILHDVGAIVQPGYPPCDAWSNMFFHSMLNNAQDNDLESQDKNG